MDELLLLLSVILLLLFDGLLAVEQATEGSVRLTGGSSNAEGKVQIYHDGKWGIVYSYHWDLSDGAVVCRQLGFLGVYRVSDGSTVRVGNWTIWLSNVGCLGTEQTLANCSHDPWGVRGVVSWDGDAGVQCMVTNDTIEGSIRLADGFSANEGRVEIYNYGEWGTVCDDNWDVPDAAVVCRQLGFPGVELAFTNSLFGGGTGRIWMKDVRCSGTEQMLSGCAHAGWDYGNICRHTEDAGVRCLVDAEPAEGALRLINGNHSSQGRLEVYYSADWGSVCDNKWGLAETKVACRQLGFKGADTFTTGAAFGKGSGQVWLDAVACKGNEKRLDECFHSGWASTECTHEMDIGVTCSQTEDGDSRLVDGSSDAHGRVEVYYQGIWGTVCKNGWNKDAADVVCMGSGYDEASKTSVNDVPVGTGMILLEGLDCIGWERSLRSCDSKGWGVHNCTHKDDIAIKCRNKSFLSWLQITGIVLGCVTVLLAICKCCFSCMDKGCANDTPVAETTQDVEEPAGEPLNPDPNGAEEKPPPAYDDVGHFPKPQAQGDTSV
eukprot:XP_795735.3 PREDICTED: neurotrypsin [Strongylocentrotus purpuratus]